VRLRTIARWIIIILASIVSAPLVRRAWSDFQNWRLTTNDPSARDAYLTFLQIDTGLLLMVIIAAVVVLGALRERGVSTPR
jgi:hypothetical protein